MVEPSELFSRCGSTVASARIRIPADARIVNSGSGTGGVEEEGVRRGAMSLKASGVAVINDS